MKITLKGMDRLTLNIFTAAGLLLLPICIAFYYWLNAPKLVLYMGIFGFVIVLPETPKLIRDLKKIIGNSNGN